MTGAPIKLNERTLFYQTQPKVKQKGIFNKLIEGFGSKLYVKEKNPESKIYNTFLPPQSEDEVTPTTLIDYAKRTPQLDLAIESLVELIMGTEININAGDEEAKQICEDFANNIDLYERMRVGLRDELITGDMIFEKVKMGSTIEKIEEIDPLAIWDAHRDKFGNISQYVLQTQDGEQLIDASKCIHFKFKQVGKEAWGRSMFYSLAVTRTVGNRTSRPMIEEIWLMEDAMAATMINHGYPLKVINYKNVNDDELEKEARKWKDFKPGDTIIQSTNEPPTVELIEPKLQEKFEPYIKHIAEVLMMGTGFSYEIFLGNFTSRASAETTDSITMKKVRAHQKYLANKLKLELFRDVLKTHESGKWKTPEAFNKANLTISFEAGHIKDLTPEEVRNRVTSGLWSNSEGREWDKENLGVDLSDEELVNVDQIMTPNPIEQEALKTYKMVQEEIKKDRIKERAKQIKKNLKK